MARQVDYYELLGVADVHATPDELKKALEWHPDKNPQRIEEATRVFAEIQRAYEVLSDDQERAWYDSHKEEILRGDAASDIAAAAAASTTSWSSAAYGITTDEVLAHMNPSRFTFSNPPPAGKENFYAAYSALFSAIEAAERDAIARDSENVAAATGSAALAAGAESRTAFGDAGTRWEGEGGVGEVYGKFLSFATVRSFRWLDRYRVSEARDRFERRHMERANARAREGGRRAFSAAVRDVAAAAQRADPRWAKQVAAAKAAREAKAAEARERKRRERREAVERSKAYEEPEWARADREHPEVAAAMAREEAAREAGEEEAEVVEELYCAACNKVFKSDRQKKRKAMMRQRQQQQQQRSDDDDDGEDVEAGERQPAAAVPSDKDDDGGGTAAPKKTAREKRREREQRKAAAAAAAGAGAAAAAAAYCVGGVIDRRRLRGATKLFQHVKAEGHALAAGSAGAAGAGSGSAGAAAGKKKGKKR
ncbi:hypothetical protein DFJ73DRAFT_910591 [Zopfochytrium polystomum]|nr:hypothetical protein DFJ73DRAFT_910591 [Zopfochytrium polystomum]